MRIGAYQFAVTGDWNRNLARIKSAILQAQSQEISLLAFPECALTGYPPIDIKSVSQIAFEQLPFVYEQLQEIVNAAHTCVIMGTIIKEGAQYYNSAIIFKPYKEYLIYSKRALWGWDRENFSVGKDKGIFEIEGWKVGVRICYEVRFPEFFRELYNESTNLNLILFYDVSDHEDLERYELTKAHIRTRAVENVTYTLSVNTIFPYQTAPTALFDRSGRLLYEQKRGEEHLLVYDLENKQMDFGEQGRKEISDRLIEQRQQKLSNYLE